MIDIGITKMAVIGVVALVVIGPEKLPKVARLAGSLFGRAQRYINDLKAEVSREMEVDEMRKLHQDFSAGAADFGRNLERSMQQTRADVHSQWSAINSDVTGSSAFEKPQIEAGSDSAPDMALIQVQENHIHPDAVFYGRPPAAVSATRIRRFRQQRVALTRTVPAWYKHRHGGKSGVVSFAARVSRQRPGAGSSSPLSS